MNNCFGCGAKLQTVNKNENAFISEKVFSQNSEAVCQRCFSIKHYNSDLGISENFDPLAEIKKITIRFSVIAIVVDIYNLSQLGRIFKDSKHLLETNKVWIIVNKVDLLPKAIKLEKVKMHISRNLKNKFIWDELIMYSSHKLTNADELLKKCNEAGRNIYLLGTINSGKSSIANSLLKAGGATADELILESHFPHTTIGSLYIPISKTHKLVDLPGLSSQEVSILPAAGIKQLNVKGEQRSTTFQLESGQSIIIDNIVRINFTKGENTAYTFYTKSTVMLHRTKSINENPKLDYQFNFKESLYKEQYFEFAGNEEMKDIEIPGIGFIRFKAKNQILETKSIFDLSVRKSII